MKLIWKNIADLANDGFSEVPRDYSGIYVVRWSREGKPVPIPRLVGTDVNGILYVGSTKKLRIRIHTLWNGINGRGKHTMDKTITFCKLQGIIRPDEFEVTLENVKDHETAFGQEGAAIVDYSEKFKEPPPLNLILSRAKYALAGLAEANKSRLAYESDDFVVSLLKQLRRHLNYHALLSMVRAVSAPALVQEVFSFPRTNKTNMMPTMKHMAEPIPRGIAYP